MARWDVVVVGGGVGGLASGALLSRAGLRVALFERSSILGGRASAQKTAGGIVERIRLFPSGDQGELAKILRYVGRPMAIENFEGLLIYHKGRLTPDRELIAPPEAHREVDRVRTEILGMSLAETEAVDDLSFQEWLGERVEGEEAELYFKARALIFFAAPNMAELSAGEVLRRAKKWIETGIHSGYPVEGWVGVYEALAEAIRAGGGAVQTRANVKEILIGDGAVEGVKVERGGVDGVEEGRVVVFNPPVWEAPGLMPEGAFPGWFRDRVEYLKSQATIRYVGMRAILRRPLYGGKSYVSAPTSPKHGAALQIFHPSNFTPNLAPRPGAHLLGCAAVLDPARFDTQAKLDAMREGLLEELEEIFPDYDHARDCEESRIVGNMALVADGVRRKPHLVWRHKPDVKAPGVGGLYFAGDTVRGTGAGTEAAAHSAEICASRILSDLRTKGRIRE